MGDKEEANSPYSIIPLLGIGNEPRPRMGPKTLANFQQTRVGSWVSSGFTSMPPEFSKGGVAYPSSRLRMRPRILAHLQLMRMGKPKAEGIKLFPLKGNNK